MNPITTDGPRLHTLDDLAGRIAAIAANLAPDSSPVVAFEAPRRREFGDFATNVAFGLAKAARKAPQALAEAIVSALRADEAFAPMLAEATAVAGFINLRMSPRYWQGIAAEILSHGADYGRRAQTGERISLEFGSANPTGPLVVVQGRTLSIGATLANAMAFSGDRVITEWIINDFGSQVETLGRSIYARYRQIWDPAYPFPQDGYQGEYVRELAAALERRDGEQWRDVAEDDAIPALASFGKDLLIADQKAVAARFGAHFDHWQSERALHESGEVARGIAEMRERGLLYDEDGAVFMRTTQFGDDKDRVVVRGDGRPTYYAPDIAYHKMKLGRADRVIDILGPDHHGYIPRLQAIAAAYGRAKSDIDVIIAQQITLKRGDEIVSMSKRAGNVVTLEEIIDEVGVDAARFFFVMLSPDSPLTFDLALAVQQNDENPVFYVQYGHARIASVIRKAHESGRAEWVANAGRGEGLAQLDDPAELALIRRLAEYPEIVGRVARHRAPHLLPRFARDVASDFHAFYQTCRILGDDEERSTGRLALVMAAKAILAGTLALCGVSAPERMDRTEETAEA